MASYTDRQRVATYVNDMVLASVDHKLIFHGRVLISCVRVLRYSHLFTHEHHVSKRVK